MMAGLVFLNAGDTGSPAIAASLAAKGWPSSALTPRRAKPDDLLRIATGRDRIVISTGHEDLVEIVYAAMRGRTPANRRILLVGDPCDGVLPHALFEALIGAARLHTARGSSAGAAVGAWMGPATHARAVSGPLQTGSPRAARVRKSGRHAA